METTITAAAAQLLRVPKSVSQSSSSRVDRKFWRTCSWPVSPIASALLGIGQQLDRALRALVDRVDEVAVLAVADLQHDAAGPPADDRPALPETLGHGEAEALAQRLLDHDVGGPLERVDLHVADLLDVREQVDVLVVAARRLDLLPDLEALGVVGGHRAREHELRVRHRLAHGLERLDHADRVLPRVVPADLADDRPVRVDPVLLADLVHERVGELAGSSPTAGRCTAAR